MRQIAWMLTLGFLVGCGAAAPAPVAVKDSSVVDVKIPAEVASLFERGQIAKVIETLTTMIDRNPKDENLYALRATAFQQQGRNDLALEDLDRAIGVNANDAKLFNNRGFVKLGQGKIDESRSDFDRAVELAPKFKNIYNNRGLMHIALRQYDAAILEFNRAISLDDQYVDAYNNRGFAEVEAGQIEQALYDFNLAIKLDGNYVNAFNNRGLLRARLGDYRNAAIDFTQAMMLDPLNPKYYQHRRDVYMRQKAYDKANADERKLVWLIQLQDFGFKIANSTEPAKELMERASHFLKVDDLDHAVVDLDRAISIDPDFPDALTMRAEIHWRKDDINAAKADAEAALKIAPVEAAYSVLGDVFLKEADYDRALANYKKARRVDENVAEAYFGKSKILQAKGQVENAEETLKHAVALDPDIEERLR